MQKRERKEDAPKLSCCRREMHELQRAKLKVLPLTRKQQQLKILQLKFSLFPFLHHQFITQNLNVLASQSSFGSFCSNGNHSIVSSTHQVQIFTGLQALANGSLQI
ncbi:hypothetical protein SLA2020_510290 [Shorea laevis]